MDRVVLGRTGLEASVLGLGCGGYSKLGRNQGKGDENALAVIRRAIDLGVNLIDTAEGYGTEPHVGKIVREMGRDNLVLCTKAGPGSRDNPRDPKEFRRAVENSLKNLQTDVIDVYEFHGVRAGTYPIVVERLLPVLLKMKEQGKVRFVGITEGFEDDMSHGMHQLSSRCDAWDTLMVGFNILNTSARRTVFPESSKRGMGILGMFAVRYSLASRENLGETLRRLSEGGHIPAKERDLKNPLGFLLDEADSLAEAAYRYCRHDQDIHVVLSGTGSIEHLEANVRAVEKGPLSNEAIAKLDRFFGKVDCESGKSPASRW